MQNESWMQPALLSGEAVLLPALERQSAARQHLGSRYFSTVQSEDVFRPASISWEDAHSAVHMPSTEHGSIAGRSVLRAAGVRTLPKTKRCRRCR